MSRLICLCFFIPAMIFAQTWQELSPFPHFERDDAVAFAIGKNGYIVTGNHNGFSESNRLWVYHSETNTWSEGSAFPGEPRQYASTFTNGPFAYLIGGISENNLPLKDVYRYDSQTDSWEELDLFPGVAHWSSATVSLPQAGYLFGGTNQTNTLKQAWHFDFASETWEVLDSLPTIGKRDMFAFNRGNQIFIGGGFSINPLTFYNEMLEYDTDNGLYQTVESYPNEGIGYGTACNYQQGGLVVGGYRIDGSFSNEAWYFDGQHWQAQNAFSPLSIKGMSSFKINETAYFLSGIYETGQRSNQLFALKETSENSNWLKVYPNPSKNGCYFEAPIGTKLTIYDISGKLLHELELSFSNTIYFSKLTIGIYILVAKNEDLETIRKIAVH
jgi:N-acetylneuraminic acid mutarotase